MRRYEETLRLVREHGPARRNLDRLEARRLEGEANDLAASGRLVEAIAAYDRALVKDPQRLHSRRSRGMALTQLGRPAEAVPDLRAAVEAGESEPAVVNALALALLERGEAVEAARLLRSAHARHPDDLTFAHNLARLLATQAAVNDGPEAVRLAQRVVEATRGRDPRALDTLAAAYAAVGRADLAARTAEEAVREARAQGESELAALIASRARAYRARR